jgi:hypothetical protein
VRYRAPPDIDEALSGFKDASSIPDWAKSDMALAKAVGLVTPCIDKMFESNGEMTRSNAAVVVRRLYNRVW